MAEAVAKTSIKPYKLKPSGDALTRDDLSTWREVLLSFMRQNEKWRPFLPGATDPNRSTWTSADDGGNNAWPAEVTRDFDDFLTCLATFAHARQLSTTPNISQKSIHHDTSDRTLRVCSIIVISDK